MRKPVSPDLNFRADAGDPSLNLVATIGEWETVHLERLRDGEDAAAWFVETGLMSSPPLVEPHDLAQIRILREAIYTLVSSLMDNKRPDRAAVSRINQFAAHRPMTLALSGSGKDLEKTLEHSAQEGLSTIARSAIALVASPFLDRIRRCAGPSCSMLFLDNSRPGKRRWCSMNRCGNKQKKRNMRARNG